MDLEQERDEAREERHAEARELPPALLQRAAFLLPVPAGPRARFVTLVGECGVSDLHHAYQKTSFDSIQRLTL